MRKALVLLAAMAVAAVVGGLAIPSAAVTAGRSSLSAAELDRELRAFTPSFECYLEARDFVQSGTTTPLAGVSQGSWGTGAVVEWSNLRTTQVLVDDYVAQRVPSAFTPHALEVAKATLENAITGEVTTAINDAQSTGTPFSCGGEANGSTTLASLPGWFLDEQVRAEAGYLGLSSLTPSPIPTSGSGLQTWYVHHSGAFDTTCLSDLVFGTQAKADSVASLVDNGLDFATAVSRYATSAANRKDHGSIGCFSPSSSQWAAVAQYVGSVATGKATVLQSGTGWYVLCPTSRRGNSLHSILHAVAAEVEALNGQSAALLATSIQAEAHVTASPSLGTWIATSTGGTIVAPSAPPSAAILNAPANTPAS